MSEIQNLVKQFYELSVYDVRSQTHILAQIKTAGEQLEHQLAVKTETCETLDKMNDELCDQRDEEVEKNIAFEKQLAELNAWRNAALEFVDDGIVRCRMASQKKRKVGI
jgi:hypothetical protein